MANTATEKKEKTTKPATAKKNVIDADASMELKLKLLYQLQQTDSKVDAIKLLRG